MTADQIQGWAEDALVQRGISGATVAVLEGPDNADMVIRMSMDGKSRFHKLVADLTRDFSRYDVDQALDSLLK